MHQPLVNGASRRKMKRRTANKPRSRATGRGGRGASPATAAGSRGIQSVEIGLRVIDAMRVAKGPLALRELASAAQLPTSNCHRYLVSFVRAGYAVQDPLTARYDLGPRLLKAGLAAPSRLDPVAIRGHPPSPPRHRTRYTRPPADSPRPGRVIPPP